MAISIAYRPLNFKLARTVRSCAHHAHDQDTCLTEMATVNSLRKKSRGAQSLPRRQSIHPGMSEGSTQPLPPPPRVQPKDKSKVESLMKRRYSTRGIPPSALEPFPSELSNKSNVADSSYGDKVNVIKRHTLTAAEWSRSPKIRQQRTDEPRV
jgi:hypothetical protein